MCSNKFCFKILFSFSIVFLVLSYFFYTQVSVLLPHQDIDSSAYIGNGLLFYNQSSFGAHSSMPYYGLGYPFFIGLIFKIFGPEINYVIFFQILISLLSGFLIFATTRRLFGLNAAAISFVLVVFNVGYLTFSQFILTEILLAFFLLLFFERFTKFLQSGGYKPLAFSAFALGLSIWIKPAAIYFPIILVLFLAVLKSVTCCFRQRFFRSLVFLFAFSIPVFACMMHNKIFFDRFELPTLSKVNLYHWYFPNVFAEEKGSDSVVERELLALLPEETVETMFWQKAMQKPSLFIYVWCKNVLKTCVGLFTSNLKILVNGNIRAGNVSFFKMEKLSIVGRMHAYIAGGSIKKWVCFLAYYEALWTVIRWFLCFITLFFLIWLKKFDLAIFIFFYLLYFAFITGHDGCARFRMLFEFVLIILAAGGIEKLWNRYFGRRDIRSF